MRAAAVLVLLGALFGAAWVWQAGTLRASRAARAAASTSPERERTRDLPAGWGLVVVGEPSGAAPVEAAPAPRDAGAPAAAPAPDAEPHDDASWRALEQRALGDYRITVRAGQTLSELCRAHYGTAPHDLVEALARYNGLKSPDAIAEGETLLLPERSRLE